MVAWLVSETASLFCPVLSCPVLSCPGLSWAVLGCPGLSWAVLGCMCFHLGRFDGQGVECLVPVLGILWLFCLRSGMG
jgi:hypothetical protein